MLHKDAVILLFAKAPIAGKVNTRLIPDIGEQAATQLQYDFIHQRLQMLADAELCDVILMCALDIEHECFVQCQQKYPVVLKEQSGGDLGARIIDGMASALESYKHCIVIGSDAPALTATDIQQAIETLQKQTDVVFVPAEDGGYVLVGLNQPYTCLFADIDWGTPEVLQQSRDVLKQKNIAFEELATRWDVDRLADYQRYQRLLAGEK